MEIRPLRNERERSALRAFLAEADAADYLLEEFDDWSREAAVYVGLHEGSIVALGRIHDLGEGDAWVSGVRVHPDLRRQGFGRKLVQELLDLAAARGCRTARAVTEDENAASRRLFGRLGFRPTAPLTLREGPARPPDADDPAIELAVTDELPGRPGWFPGEFGVCDVIPHDHAGFFGAWRSALLGRWVGERKLWIGSDLAIVVLRDWIASPSTIWAQPLAGSADSVLSAFSVVAHRLGAEAWQAFLPADGDRPARYDALGAAPHATWGCRAHLFEARLPEPSGPRGASSGR
jgi:GNAT superfamily N-acetyltransferase